MNLRTLYDKIKETCQMIDPNMGDIYYGDIYQLNHIQTVKYPAVVITSGHHRADLDDEAFIFKLNIFYVERLIDSTYDNEQNKIDVHANGIKFINTLLKYLDDEIMISRWDIHCFNERFNDVCAGVYVNAEFRFVLSECWEMVNVIDGRKR